jgi:L-threonylcarbamoyladenylate synthase
MRRVAERLTSSADGIAAAAALLLDGALVAFPTDTVYGIGCRVGDPVAIGRLFEAKRRPAERRIPILVIDLDQAVSLGYGADSRARELAERFWPGALTVVLADGSTPSTRLQGATQAFRVPNHAVALELIARSGPLATTSANRSAEPETYEADDVLIAFADTDLLAAVLDGGTVPGGVASTVIDLSVTPARLVREGPVTRKSLAEVIDLAPPDRSGS